MRKDDKRYEENEEEYTLKSYDKYESQFIWAKVLKSVMSILSINTRQMD